MDLIKLDLINKELKITRNDLNINKVLVQEEYNIEYDYKKKMDAKKIVPSKLTQLNIP